MVDSLVFLCYNWNIRCFLTLDLDIAFHNIKPKNYKGVYKMQNNSDLILRTYNIIDETANSDAMIEAISGFL